MKLVKKFLTGLTLAATASLSVQAQTVTLDVLYCYPSFARFHEPLAAEYMKQNPNVKIQFRAPSASYDEGHQVILRSAVTNQLPDVYYAGFHLLGEMARTLEKRNQITDLSTFIKGETANYATSNFAPRMMSLSQVDGKQYGMAFNASSPIMYFNTELVRKAGGDPRNMPTNWNDLITLAGKINAQNKDNARAFLRYLVSPAEQTIINNGANLGQLPVNSAAAIDDDKFLNEGFTMLSTNSPGGVAQFFDRDFPAEMAKAAMEGMQEFMVFPDNLDDILERLESVRQDVY